MTAVSVSPPHPPSPAGLALDPDALADVCTSLRRSGGRLRDAAVLQPPDTGSSTGATRSALSALLADADRVGGELQRLGRGLAAFTDLVADVDDRTRAEIDRVRGGALW